MRHELVPQLRTDFQTGVGRVVGDDDIQRAVGQGLPHRLAVACASKRRIHLGVGVVVAHSLVGQREVVGRGFRRDPHAARFGGPDDVQ